MQYELLCELQFLKKEFWRVSVSTSIITLSHSSNSACTSRDSLAPPSSAPFKKIQFHLVLL